MLEKILILCDRSPPARGVSAAVAETPRSQAPPATHCWSGHTPGEQEGEIQRRRTPWESWPALTHPSSTTSGKEALSAVSQVEKLKASQAPGLTETHTAAKSQGWDSKKGLLGSLPVPLPHDLLQESRCERKNCEPWAELSPAARIPPPVCIRYRSQPHTFTPRGNEQHITEFTWCYQPRCTGAVAPPVF